MDQTNEQAEQQFTTMSCSARWPSSMTSTQKSMASMRLQTHIKCVSSPTDSSIELKLDDHALHGGGLNFMETENWSIGRVFFEGGLPVSDELSASESLAEAAKKFGAHAIVVVAHGDGCKRTRLYGVHEPAKQYEALKELAVEEFAAAVDSFDAEATSAEVRFDRKDLAVAAEQHVSETHQKLALHAQHAQRMKEAAESRVARPGERF